MIAKDGFKIIFYTGILVLILLILAIQYSAAWLWILTLLCGVVFVFHFFFFRDPERDIPSGDHLILSPADGRIIKIDQVEEPVYMKGPALRVAIFMSIFNAHINRNPISGTVEHVVHKSGQFLAAFAEDAPDANERFEIGMQSKYGKIFFIQIAGLIARRIVCRLTEGQKATAGLRFGMIKYSSRVDLFLPVDTKLKVALKDNVRAGKTIIGELAGD